MSLLMDALKKAELAKRQGQGAAAGEPVKAQGPHELSHELTLEPIIDSGVTAPAAAAELSSPALAAHLEDIDTRFLAEAREAASARLKAQSASARALEPPAVPAAGGGQPSRTPGAAETRRPQAGKSAPQNPSAAQNIFAAKRVGEPPPRKAFALAVGTATALSLCAIAGYFWWQLRPHSSLIATPLPPVATSAPAAVPPAPTIATPPVAPIADATGAVPAAPTAEERDTTGAAKAPVQRRRAPSIPRPAPALAAVAEADTESPVRVTKAALKINPALLRGFDAFNRGDLDLAQREYERAQQSDPRNTDALHGLAAIALRQGRHDEADVLYRRIVEADPQDPLALSALINSRAQIDPGAAESRLKTLSAAQPELAAPQFALGNLYARQSRWNEAQQAYFRAYGAEQDNPDILYNLAISLEHLRQNKLAAQYYSLAVSAAQSRPAGFDRAQATARLHALQR